jgi:hypothetical protein
MLPTNFEKKETTVFELIHTAADLKTIEQHSHTVTTELIKCLIQELNSKFMCELGDCSPVEQAFQEELYDPDVGAGDNDLKLFFVGGSHAARMAAAADNAGMDVANLAKPGFRVTEQAVENTAILLEDELSLCSKRAVVLYHMYDNNVYFASQEDGSRSLPVKDPHDNTYHIPGSLEFADHTVMKKLVHLTVPLLRAAGEREKIVLSPLPHDTSRSAVTGTSTLSIGATRRSSLRNWVRRWER